MASVAALVAALAVLLLLPGASAPAAAAADADEITVRSLAKDGRILVSFTLNSGLTDELRDAIRGGLPATITYEVVLRRGSLLWFDRTIARATVTASVRFDNLTRQHQLSRTIDGRGEAPRVTEDEDEVRAWLTEVQAAAAVRDGLARAERRVLRPGAARVRGRASTGSCSGRGSRTRPPATTGLRSFSRN